VIPEQPALRDHREIKAYRAFKGSRATQAMPVLLVGRVFRASKARPDPLGQIVQFRDHREYRVYRGFKAPRESRGMRVRLAQPTT
jgi:hypothetical protein